MKTNNLKNNSGIILLNTLVFGMVAVMLIVALSSWFTVTYRGSRKVIDEEQAFHIAEAGIEYYRWHLAHAPQDFTDGNAANVAQPYKHDFFDKNDEKIGEFELTIIAPESGSTLVTVESKGILDASGVSKTIRAEFAKPTFAKYAFISNENIRLGEGTEVFGLIHSNEGVRFEGVAHNLVTSAQTTYDDPDHGGAKEWGVHTHVDPVDPMPNTPLPNRFDIFQSGREVGVPAIDFDGLTATMADLKSKAQADGRYHGSSGKSGYNLVLKTNGTYQLYKVNSLINPSNSCNNALGQPDWGSWSINKRSLVGTYQMPDNGVIFLEDHVWVEGQIDEERLTIVAARFPEAPGQYRNIIINKDILYSNMDGQDVLGLIAQGDINIGMYSDDVLDIHAAMIAKNGRIGRYYYRPPSNNNGCSPYHTRNTINVYGMIGTNGRYGFAYTDDTGYINRNVTYDANLLYNSPPEFPLTADQYEIISWEELD
ncbi:MAG: pilus assembly PilX N-terminal domain-containing protein [Candidatus Paceibacterota bacterium]